MFYTSLWSPEDSNLIMNEVAPRVSFVTLLGVVAVPGANCRPPE